MFGKGKKKQKPIPPTQEPLENQLAFLTLLAGLIPALVLLATLWYFEASRFLIAIVAVFLAFLLMYCVVTVWRQSQYQFRSLHNLLDAIVRGDYSFRGSRTANSGALGELIATINALAKTLHRQRLQSEESSLLLQKIVDQIDVAIIAWDQHQHVQLINPAARALLTLSETFSSAQRIPTALEFANTMEVGTTQVKELAFASAPGRYRLHLERFIADGNTHNLLFMTNVSSLLRLEERRAWRNLVRVLSHEINNTLTPMTSFSKSLKMQIEKRESDETLKQELLDGVTVIGNRAASLAQFVRGYHKIASMPEPDKRQVDFAMLAGATVKLFESETIQVKGESLLATVDPAQIEQVLINLVKNAVESGNKDEPIVIAWHQEGSRLLVKILDRGEGIQNPENLFTPYYSTKPAGSGIGLVFCQQVVEAHDGMLTIDNRQDGPGCEVTINLPC